MTQRIAAASIIAALLLFTSPVARAATSTLNLRTGQTLTVPGTSVAAKLTRVVDFTSQGCEGGPQGCPDHVVLAITSGKSTTSITLYVAHNTSQRAQNLSRKTVYGVQFILISVHVNTAVVRAVTS